MDKCEKIYIELEHQLDAAEQYIRDLKDIIARCESALSWYGQKENYDFLGVGIHGSLVDFDRGKLARNCKEKIKLQI